MFDDPHFAYNYIRPVAVVAGAALGFHIAWNWLDRRIRKRDERAAKARDVTPE